MRLQATEWATALVLVFTTSVLVGCGGGDAEAPTTSINSDTEGTAPSVAAPSVTTPASEAGAAESRKVATAAPKPAQSRYSQAGAATTTTTVGSRYPSFVSNQETRVTLTTNKGVITLRLFADKAPQTVNNFLRNYVETSYYDGSIVHYADETMVIAGGFRRDYSEIPPTLPVRNEANNGLKNVRGTVAMGRLPDSTDSATSHFFFNVQDNTDFDHAGQSPADYGYCVFGEVIEGMAIVDRIAKSPTRDENGLTNVPSDPIVIEKVRVSRR